MTSRLLVMLAAAVLGAGCGGTPEGDRSAGSEREGSSAEQRREEGARRLAEALPPRDRTAFYELTAAYGAANARVTSAIRGRRGGVVGAADVRASVARVRALRPDDGLLRAARSRLLTALDATARSFLPPARARAAAAALGPVRRLLERYTRHHPQVAGLVPD